MVHGVFSFWTLPIMYLEPGARKGYVTYFTEENFIELAELLKSLQGRFKLTINDDSFIRGLFKEFEINEVNMRYNVTKGGRKNFKELWKTNY